MEYAGNGRFIPVSDFDQFHPWPTVGALRVRICQAEKDGGDKEFLKCVVRVGTRVLIDEVVFVEWMRSHTVKDEAA